MTTWRCPGIVRCAANITDALFPKKLPPLELTSKPVAVRDIWGFYNYKRDGALASTGVHVVLVALLIGGTMFARRAVTPAKPTGPVMPLLADNDIPALPPSKTQVGGGGGGGDRDKLAASKGRLPKFAMEQFTPPMVVVRNDGSEAADGADSCCSTANQTGYEQYAEPGRSDGGDSERSAFERNRFRWRHWIGFRRRRRFWRRSRSRSWKRGWHRRRNVSRRWRSVRAEGNLPARSGIF